MPSLPVMRILVVDGDPAVADLVRQHLREHRDSIAFAPEIKFAAQPVRALEMARSQIFDFIVCGCALSDPGTIDLLKSLGHLQPECWIIVASDPVQQEMLAAPPYDTLVRHVLLKPFTQAALVRAFTSAPMHAERSSQPWPRRPTMTTLRITPLLADLPESALLKLNDVASWITLAPGEMIVRQNDEISSVLLMISGHVKIMRGNLNGERDTSLERRHRDRPAVMLALLGPGDLIGESAAVLDNRSTATVVAFTPCQMIKIPSADFVSVLTDHPEFALAIMRKMAVRLIESEWQVELMRGSVEARIHALFRRCKEIGIDTDVWLSNTEIARLVGATRVAVSQIMSKIQRSGRAPLKKSKQTVKKLTKPPR